MIGNTHGPMNALVRGVYSIVSNSENMNGGYSPALVMIEGEANDNR